MEQVTGLLVWDPPQAGRAEGAQAGGIHFPRPQIK